MKKSLFILLIGLVLFWIFAVTNNSIIPKPYFERTYAATTGSVTLTANVQPYLSVSNYGHPDIEFGNLTPGVPICSPMKSANFENMVTTNASNGYTVGVSDGIAGNNSGMKHIDNSTYITDMNSGTIATPVTWVTGTHTGLGINLAWGTQRNATTWGIDWADDNCLGLANKKWAAVPPNSTVAYTVTGYHASGDYSSWIFMIDVPNTQKTGIYTGTILYSYSSVLI